VNGRIATRVDKAVMTEGGIETVVIAVIAVIAIGGCQDATLDAKMTSAHDGIGIFLKGVTIVAGRPHGLVKTIAMNSPCKWEHVIERRMLAHRQRRRSPRLI